MTNTLTITLTDSVTGKTGSTSVNFVVGQVTVTSPGDQNGTVGTPI